MEICEHEWDRGECRKCDKFAENLVKDYECVIQYTMKWLEEFGFIHACKDGSRQACVPDDGHNDREGALLDVICEMALNGTLDTDFVKNIRGIGGDLNIRECFKDQIKNSEKSSKV